MAGAVPALVARAYSAAAAARPGDCEHDRGADLACMRIRARPPSWRQAGRACAGSGPGSRPCRRRGARRRARSPRACGPSQPSRGGDPAGQDSDVDGVLVRLQGRARATQAHGAAHARLGPARDGGRERTRARASESSRNGRQRRGRRMRRIFRRAASVPFRYGHRDQLERRRSKGADARGGLTSCARRARDAPSPASIWNSHNDGVFRCAACGAELFELDDQVGVGWRFAELPPNRRSPRRWRPAATLLPRHEPHRGRLPPLRRPPGPRLQRHTE